MDNNNLEYLNVPQIQSVRYKQNFIRTAVCEFRFPTLLELEENPPVHLQRLLRKEYPHFSKELGVSLGEAGATPMGNRYLFESKSHDWTISLRASSAAIETSRYTTFEELYSRIEEFLNVSKDLLDTDFFTRVGLRFINTIPINDGEIEGWLNQELITGLNSGIFGTINSCNSEVRGFLENGEYTFKHGCPPRSHPTKPVEKYFLDFDYFSEGVEFSNALKLIDGFHDTNFSLFRWAIGDKALEILGQEIPKD